MNSFLLAAALVCATALRSDVCVLQEDAPTPRCERTRPALMEATAPGSIHAAVAALAAKVREAGGDTLKLRVRGQGRKGKTWKAEGWGFVCGDMR